jgi:pheromone a factor receptor
MANLFIIGLLGFRLFHYRREFGNLITARNTTKSRFIRLFLMALYVSIILVPYSFFILYQLADTIVDEYSWSRVHGPDWNTVIKVPANGVVRWDRWGEVAAGYIAFILFGTGTDANNTYKGLLTSVGLGKLFPSLYVMSESSGVQTPTSVTFVKRWTSNWSSKAKSLISKNGSFSEPSRAASFSESVIQPVFTNEEVVPVRQHHDTPRTKALSFFSRIFNRRTTNHSVLPIHRKLSTDTERLPVLDKTRSNPSAFIARAWAADDNTGEKNGEVTGVQIVREVHQASQDRSQEKKIGDVAWV